MADEKFSLFDIIIIACFISLVFSPVGLVLMWLKSKWSKKIKLIITGGFVLLYTLIAVLLILLNKSPEAGGGSGGISFGIEQSLDGGGGGTKQTDYKPTSKSVKSKKSTSSNSSTQSSGETFFQQATKSRWFYFFILVFIIGIIAVFRNLKWKNTKDDFNPYVDTSLYQLPIPDDFVFPEIKYTKLNLMSEEKLFFATPAEIKNNSGDIVITNKRFVFLGRKENYDFQIKSLTSIYSLSNTTLSLTVGEKTYYFFIHHTQMRFVLQITRYAYGK